MIIKVNNQISEGDAIKLHSEEVKVFIVWLKTEAFYFINTLKLFTYNSISCKLPGGDVVYLELNPGDNTLEVEIEFKRELLPNKVIAIDALLYKIVLMFMVTPYKLND